jgi:GNAT superfamily N-acetyltransferase
MSVPAGAPCTIEPLDPALQDRAAFSCGIVQVDNYFRKTANKLAKSGNVCVFVLTSPQGEVIGLYATNAHAVHYAHLPERFARNRPGHGHIPAAYISMIGVDHRHQRKGYGGDLLVDCLRRIAGAADLIGIRVVLLDVLDCGDPDRTRQRRDLYASYGFTPLPSNTLRMVLPIGDVRALVAEF